VTRPFLTALWTDLAVLNFEAEPAWLEPHVPRGTELDDFRGRYYVSVVGFWFRDTRVLGVPVPFHRHFEEINLRLYVRRREGDEVRRGVVFVREVVPKRAIAGVARWVYNENYVRRPTASDVSRPAGGAGRVEYRWQDAGTWLAAGVEIAGEPAPPAAGSAEEFIIEHYWGYVRRRDGGTSEYRVEHPPWRVWPGKRAWLHGDASGFYRVPCAEALRRPPAFALVADGSPVAVYRGRRLPDEPQVSLCD
jgi:hypothetical protein